MAEEKSNEKQANSESKAAVDTTTPIAEVTTCDDDRMASIFNPSTVENTQNNVDDTEVEKQANKSSSSNSKAQATTETQTATAGGDRWQTIRRFTFNHNLPQRFKNMQDYWQQRKIRFDRDSTHLMWICIICVICVTFSICALFTNSWTCAPGKAFGLWNTCFEQPQPQQFNETTDNTWNETNVTATTSTTELPEFVMQNVSGIVCAKQDMFDVKMEFAEQSRIDQVAASQGLLIAGTVLYLFSVCSMFVAYKFMNIQQNLNSMRNALVTAMFVQLVAFFMQLAGFLLFIMTDRFSISVGLLFVYFAMAMFATNIINFITIEYKMYKQRKMQI